ncbi:hypothetical protein ANCDUO_19269 [Ancylostoma duodenale]|uniref:Uncharacterized protein n=1 Tax=Ancylostoma duodenale TaxID=51022 RepID=A0A0C2FQ51_9BILA|nr:hypothetical protein ANCDUO_19269 [Ancylostoma duodenale]
MHTCIGGFLRGSDHPGQEDEVRHHRTDRGEGIPATERQLRHWRRAELGGVGVLVNTSLVMNIDSFEQLPTWIGSLRERCKSLPSFTIFVAYAPTLSHDEDEIEEDAIAANIAQLRKSKATTN